MWPIWNNIFDCHNPKELWKFIFNFYPKVHLQDITSHIYTISGLNKLYGDGSTKCIYKCKSKRCHIKNVFSAQDRVVSGASKGIFDSVMPSGAAYFDSLIPIFYVLGVLFSILGWKG